MSKITLGVCLTEDEYKKRFCALLMNYYRDRLLLHIFTDLEEIPPDGSHRLDAILLEDVHRAEEFAKSRATPVICLAESPETNALRNSEKTEFAMIEKYSDVNAIMEEVFRVIGQEASNLPVNTVTPNSRLLGVYGIGDRAMQFPLAVFIASMLAEKEKVLVLDLQENSGFSEWARPPEALCLEDILLLAHARKLRAERVREAIGHHDNFDFVYPVDNSEVLSEPERQVYADLLTLLREELHYTVIVINFGVRFQGFFEMLNQCQQVFFLQKRAESCKWMEQSFRRELSDKGYESLEKRMDYVELPAVHGGNITCERLVEQWKWSEFGDGIRKLLIQKSLNREDCYE